MVSTSWLPSASRQLGKDRPTYVIADDLADDVFKAASVESILCDPRAHVPADDLICSSCRSSARRPRFETTTSTCLSSTAITSPTTPARALSIPRRAMAATTSTSGWRTWPRTRQARHRHAHPLHRRCRWLLHRGSAGVHRPPRHRRQGQQGRRQRGRHQGLIEAGNLVARGKLKHQYPHSWRSKKPVIFRNTPQWFIALDKPIEQLPAQPSP